METENILISLTAHRYMEDTQSERGVWLGEFNYPYYVFLDAGCAVTLVITAFNRRFLAVKEMQFHFQNTLALQNVIADPFAGYGSCRNRWRSDYRTKFPISQSHG